jgi:hypothetical protein
MSKPKNAWNIPEKCAEIKKEAFRRSPLYRQEFEAAFRAYRNTLSPNMAGHPDCDLIEPFQLSIEAQYLCQRWKLAFALHPDDQLWDSSPEDAPAFFKDPGNAVEVIPHGKPKYVIEKGQVDFIPHLREGRYLRLDIDLNASKGQIEAGVSYRVKQYQDLIIGVQVLKQLRGPTKITSTPLPDDNLPVEQWIAERNKQEEQGIAEIRKQVEKNNAFRRRRQSLDIYLDEEPPGGPVTIFQMWDMNKKEGKSPWKIAQELYPCLKGTSYQDYEDNYDINAKRLRKQIDDAIKRADKIIASISLAL